MPEFIALKNDCHFVRGPRRGAIYDLKNRRVYSVEPEVATLLSFCAEGMPFGDALKKASPGNGLSETWIRGRLGLYSTVMGLEKRGGMFSPMGDRLAGPKGYREAAWIEVTNRCNLSCVHCYSMARPATVGELSLAQWQDAVDQLVSLGWSRFSISGGEPFCRPDLFAFIDYILRDPSRSVSVITNGTMLTGDAVRYLLRHGIPLAITLYSHSPVTHDMITGKRGSWEKTVKGIGMAVEAGLQFAITVPTGAQNQGDREDTIDFLVSLGVDREQVQITSVFPLGRGCNSKVLPDVGEPFDLRARGCELRMTDDGRLLYAACWAGKILLKADGGVCLCPLARDGDFVMGNIKALSLEEIIGGNRLKEFWDLNLDGVEVCGECEFRYGCRDCRPAVHMYTGQLFLKDHDCPYDPATGEWEISLDRECAMDTCKWIKTDKYAARPLEDELILLDENNRTIHLLNRVGAEIYGLLDDRRSLQDIVGHLTGLYEVEETRLRVDVEKVLGQLERLGAVSRAGG